MASGIKCLLRKIIGDTCTGMLDYCRCPATNVGDDAPFNGQNFRKQIFIELIEKLSFDAIVETGSYLGSTTGYLYGKSGLPVYTVECNRRWHGYVRARFLLKPDIHTAVGDSRDFIKNLSYHAKLADKNLFFYLDAHWNNDLPLGEEVSSIFGAWQNAVIMIDDFQVPDDPDYGFDSYGEGKALELGYLQSALNRQFFVFFPKKEGRFETGRKRGNVVICSTEEMEKKLQKLKTLRQVIF